MTRLIVPIRRISPVLVFLLCCACSSAPAIDKAKFEALYRAARNVEGAIDVGINLIRYRELLQTLSTEILIAQDKAATAGERDMVTMYERALRAYEDAETVWTKQVGGSTTLGVSEPEMKRIADDYPISGNGSGTAFTFPAKEAVQTIWQTAGRHLRQGTAAYNGEDVGDLPTPQ